MDTVHPLWPWLAYAVLVVLMAASIISLSYILGERHKEPGTETPYECGIPPTGSARLRSFVDFYQVALFFIIFDAGSVFIVTWAVQAKVLGWTGFVSAAAFIGVMASALFYLWQEGALDVGPKRGRQ